MAINLEQERVIGKLEELLKFFRGTQIKNEGSLLIFSKQLDSLLPLLKYLPTEPYFDSFPAEIKTNILDYLCDSGAFVAASVCQEWKEILKRKVKQLDQLRIEDSCSNEYECEDIACFMPEEILKASATHKLDIPLSFSEYLEDIDTQIIVEGLTSVSNLSIKNDPDIDEFPLLPHQFKQLFEELESKGKVMESLELINMDLTHLDQDKLINYLLSKVRKLTLNELSNGKILDNELFTRTLLQNLPDDSELFSLTIETVLEDPDPDNWSVDLADAVCNVKNVKLDFTSDSPEREDEIAKRLIENIQTQNIKMKNLEFTEHIDWRPLISPEELKSILEKMDGLNLVGMFTEEQVEAVKSLDGIEANLYEISKSSTSVP